MSASGLLHQLRKPPVFVPLLVAVVVAFAALGWVLIRDDGFSYDESAHRRVIEATYGEDHVQNWQKYRDAWLGVCESEDLGLTAAVFTDGGTSPAEFALNIEYVCPDRRSELPPEFRILG